MSPTARRSLFPLLIILMLGLLIQPVRSSTVSASAASARQSCKTVKQHGKKHRICKPVKGHPTPTSSLDDLARDLAIAGVHDGANNPLSANALAGAVESGIAQAANKPSDPTSLAPLLVRELGLRHQPAIDLTAPFPASQIRLDPLQRYLLSADILIPWSLTATAAAASGADLVGRQSSPSWLFGGGPYPPSPVEQAVQQLLP